MQSGGPPWLSGSFFKSSRISVYLPDSKQEIKRIIYAFRVKQYLFEAENQRTLLKLWKDMRGKPIEHTKGTFGQIFQLEQEHLERLYRSLLDSYNNNKKTASKFVFLSEILLIPINIHKQAEFLHNVTKPKLMKPQKE